MKSRLLTWLGIVLILEAGLLHILRAQAEYEQVQYMGYLFAADFFGTLIAAWAIYHRQSWGWALGLAISIFSIGGFVWSRTVGIPGIPVQEWLAPYEIVSAGTECAFIALYLVHPWKVPRLGVSSSTESWLMYGLPAVGLFTLFSVSAFANSWEFAATQEYGHHVGSLDQVCTTPLTSFDDLQELYGVQVSLMAVSMLDSIVDVRLKVVDPEKASVLLKNQAALLVDQKMLVLAPHQHHHGSVKRGKIHFIFFPTLNNTIQAGSQVSLVFGQIRVEPFSLR